MLLAAVNEIADPGKYAVSPGRDFTRNRKMGFHDILMLPGATIQPLYISLIWVTLPTVSIDSGGRKCEYQVNFAEAFKTCRDFLRIHDGRTEMDAEVLTAQNIKPVRTGRTFARQHRFKLPISFCYRY